MKRRTARPATVLVLRTCASDMTAHGGFKWPEKGHVECPDWDSAPKCGNGLHGLLWGTGDSSLMNWDTGAKWLVVEVDANLIVPIGTSAPDTIPPKVKFPRGVVIYAGDRKGATDLIRARAPANYVGSIHGVFVIGGHGAKVTGGDYATVTGGHRATVTGGDCAALQLRWWDGARWRIEVGYIGETLDAAGEVLEMGVAYKLDDQHKWARVAL